jgi:putative hydrolase of the HAD superfamily
MVEDSVANLKPAKDLGMTTILVGNATPGSFVDRQLAEVVELPAALADWGSTGASLQRGIAPQ